MSSSSTPADSVSSIFAAPTPMDQTEVSPDICLSSYQRPNLGHASLHMTSSDHVRNEIQSKSAEEPDRTDNLHSEKPLLFDDYSVGGITSMINSDEEEPDYTNKLYSEKPLLFDDYPVGSITSINGGERRDHVKKSVTKMDFENFGVSTRRSPHHFTDQLMDEAISVDAKERYRELDPSASAVLASDDQIPKQPAEFSESETEPQIDVISGEEAIYGLDHLATCNLATDERSPSSSLREPMNSVKDGVSIVDAGMTDCRPDCSATSNPAFDDQLPQTSSEDSVSSLDKDSDVFKASAIAEELPFLSWPNSHNELQSDTGAEGGPRDMPTVGDENPGVANRDMMQASGHKGEKPVHGLDFSSKCGRHAPLVSQLLDRATPSGANAPPVSSSTTHAASQVTDSDYFNTQVSGDDAGEESDETTDKWQENRNLDRVNEDVATSATNDMDHHMSNNPAFLCQHDGDPDIADSGQVMHGCTDGQLDEGRTPACPMRLHIRQIPDDDGLEKLPDFLPSNIQDVEYTAKFSTNSNEGRLSEVAAQAEDGYILDTALESSVYDKPLTGLERSGKLQNQEEQRTLEQPEQGVDCTPSPDHETAFAEEKPELSFSSIVAVETAPELSEKTHVDTHSSPEAGESENTNTLPPKQTTTRNEPNLNPVEKSTLAQNPRLSIQPPLTIYSIQPETMVHELISEQPKATPSRKKPQETVKASEQSTPNNSNLWDDGVAQTALFGTLAAMMVMVYKAGTA